MADNTRLNENTTTGDLYATREISHGGDTAKLGGTFIMGIAGTEGSYTAAAINGDATNGLDVDVTRVSGNVTVVNAGTFAVQVDGDALTALQLIDDAVGAEGAALNKGILIQGDDGTDRTNVLVDTDGHLQVDIVTCAGSVTVIGRFIEGSAPATTSLVGIAGRYDATPRTLDDGTGGALALTTNGYVITSVNGTVTVDCNSSNVTLTGNLPDTAAGDLAAMVVDLAAMEVLLGTIDADTSNLATIASDTTSIDGKITACNTGAVTISAALPAGTNAIGKLAANSGVDIGDVDVLSIAAGTNTIGGTIAQLSTSAAYDGTTSATIKRATGIAASGSVNMIAAVASYQFRVLALALIATSATVTNVYVHNDDNDILGDSSNPIPLGTDADGDMIPGVILPFNPGGWFQTDTDNENLTLTLSAAQDVIYAVTYIEVT